MSFDYAKMEKVANRLVGKFGTQAVILRYSDGDPELPSENPWEGTTEPQQILTAYPCNITINWTQRLINGSTVISPLLMVSREGLLIEPETSDLIQLTHEDRAFQVVSVKPIMPGGYVVYWELTAS